MSVRRRFWSFYQNETDIIISALQFAGKKVKEYYAIALRENGELHRKVLSQKEERIINDINNVIKFLQKYPDANTFRIHPTTLSLMSDIMRSALGIYSREISKIDNQYEIEDYKNQKRQIEKILNTDILKDSKTGLFDKYYNPLILSKEKIEYFISYSHKDKTIVSKIVETLDKESTVFIAHRDIPLSQEWRDDIMNHLQSCSILLAICTPNYECSAWGNQEVGIALEKGKKVIPIFQQGVDKSRFGFLEAIQGPPRDFNEDNLKNLIEEIIEALTP